MNNFLFLGGDMRSIYAAGRLNKQFDTFLFGFEELDFIPETPMLREIGKYKSIVLPLPASVDGVNINAPYSKNKIPLQIIANAIESGGTVYCGKAPTGLVSICEENNLKLVDYFEREELAVMNAVPTAEGALDIIMRENGATIYGMNILLTGYGRITKVLVKYLAAMGANVTVSARKYSDLSWARIMGCRAVHLSEIKNYLSQFDTIVNTVPAQLFGKGELSMLKPSCLIVDLASKTGVEDIELAGKMGVNVVWALSLPGKVAPITAGEIIADTILNILAENSKCGGMAND